MSSNSDFWNGGGSLASRVVAVEQQMTQLNASFIGQYVSLPPQADSPNLGLIEPNGATLSKTAYPALWEWVERVVGTVTGSDYDAIVTASPIGMCTRYADLGGDSFRIPTIGIGGFNRFLGSAGQAPIGDGDGGFGSQVENHKHATIASDVTSSIRIGWAADTTNNDSMFGYIRSDQTDGAYGFNGTIIDNASYVSNYTVNSGNKVYLTSGSIHENSGETSPQGGYVKLYLYTGSIVSNLPTPPADWLAQQAVNTAEIAKTSHVIGYPTPWVVIGTSGAPDYLDDWYSNNDVEGLRYRFIDADTVHVKGIVRTTTPMGNSSNRKIFDFPDEIADRLPSSSQYAPASAQEMGYAITIVYAGGYLSSYCDGLIAGSPSYVTVNHTFDLY